MSDIKKLILNSIDAEWRTASELWNICGEVWQPGSFKMALNRLSDDGKVEKRRLSFAGNDLCQYRRILH